MGMIKNKMDNKGGKPKESASAFARFIADVRLKTMRRAWWEE